MRYPCPICGDDVDTCKHMPTEQRDALYALLKNDKEKHMARAEYGPLIQQFTEDLTNVKAPLTDYIEALDSAIGELEMMKDAAEQDLEREQEGED